jgi:hypothetical protein
VARAKSAFRNFSASRFAGQPPANYVPAEGTPAEVQRKVITQHLNNLSEADTANRAMTLALPEASIRKLLPSFDAQAGTIELSDVITLIAKNMRGTEFYTNGNPTLNRLALQSQVRQIIASIRQGGKK